VNVSRRGRQR